MEAILNEIHEYCGNECCSSQHCPEEACVLYRIERLVVDMEPMTLERAKELLKILINDMSGTHLSGEPLDIEDTINYLFTLDFTEEELIELGFSEDAIDSANANIMSAPEQFERHMKVKVTIEETVAETFEIEVPYNEDGLGDATEIGIEKYKAGELVLEPGEVQFRQIMAESIDGTASTGWTEF